MLPVKEKRLICYGSGVQTVDKPFWGGVGGAAAPLTLVRIARLCRAGGEFPRLRGNIPTVPGGKDRLWRAFSTSSTPDLLRIRRFLW